MSDAARIGLAFLGFLLAFLTISSLLFPGEVGELIKRVRGVEITSGSIKANLDAAVQDFQSAKQEVEQKTPTEEDTKALRNIIGGSNILWVDDNPDNNKAEINMLRNLGHTVDVARSNDAAVRLYALRHYNLIISDIYREKTKLATFSTPEFIERNKTGETLPEQLQRVRPTPPVIFYVQRMDRGPLSERGGHPVVNTPTELIQLIEIALNQQVPAK